jgi:hypothetical protein
MSTAKLLFILLLIDDCFLQLSFFVLYSYVPLTYAVLHAFIQILPLLMIVLFLFKVKLLGWAKPFLFMTVPNALGALILAFNGWGFEPVLAWTTMFWAVIVLGQKFGVNANDRLYLAVFSILPLTVLWELPWLLLHNGLSLNYVVLTGSSGLSNLSKLARTMLIALSRLKMPDGVKALKLIVPLI